MIIKNSEILHLINLCLSLVHLHMSSPQRPVDRRRNNRSRRQNRKVVHKLSRLWSMLMYRGHVCIARPKIKVFQAIVGPKLRLHGGHYVNNSQYRHCWCIKFHYYSMNQRNLNAFVEIKHKRVDYNYFKKWWKLWTLHGDHLKPRSVCRRSDMIYPSSQRHFSAPGPPRYEGGGDPSWTAPNLCEN